MSEQFVELQEAGIDTGDALGANLIPKFQLSPFYVVSILLVLALIGVVIFYRLHKGKEITYAGVRQGKSQGRNKLYPFYVIYTRTPGLRQLYENIRKRFQILYPVEMREINIMTTRRMTLSLGIIAAVYAFIIVTSRGDIFYIGMGTVLTYVLYTQVVRIFLDKSEIKLLEQLRNFCTNVSHNYYTANRSVPDAVFMSQDEAPYEMSLHAGKIYDCLNAADIEKAADGYIQAAPNRFFLLFVAICVTVTEYGDKRLDDGQWMFLSNLSYLRNEIDIELLKIKKNNYLFSGLQMVALAPLLFIKLIELWAVTNMPEIASYYSGAYGSIALVVIFAIVMLSYSLVTGLKEGRNAAVQEHPILNRLSRVRWISRSLNAVLKKRYTRYVVRTEQYLRLTGETYGPKQFLLKRVLWGVTITVAALVVFETATLSQLKFIREDYEDVFMSSYIEDDEYEKVMEETAKKYAELHIKDETYDKKDLVEEIQASSQVTEPIYAELVADVVIEKLDQVHKTYYRWWYLIVALLLGVIGFYAPFLLLLYRARSMKMSMEDEVAQFQTLVVILMYVDNMSISLILEWMERFAVCFRNSVATCIINLAYGEEEALVSMRDSESFEPFRRFCNNILLVNDQGIIAAFSEIASERKNEMENRKTDNEILITKKSERARWICMAPLAAEIALYLIYPMLALAMDMVSEVNSVF